MAGELSFLSEGVEVLHTIPAINWVAVYQDDNGEEMLPGDPLAMWVVIKVTARGYIYLDVKGIVFEGAGPMFADEAINFKAYKYNG